LGLDNTPRTSINETRERLASIVDSSDDAIISKTLEGVITAWNPGAEKLFGYAPSEVLGNTVRLLLPKDREDEETNILSRIGRGERVDHFETIRVRKDGRLVDVSVTISPIRNAFGVIIGASKIARDITEHKRTEAMLARQAQELIHQTNRLLTTQAALESQTALLQSVLDSIGEGLVAADESGKFLLWNPAAQRILGLDAAEITSTHCTEHYGLFLSDTVTPFPSERNPLARAILGESSTEEMFVHNPELSQGRWIEANGRPLIGANGLHRGGVVAIRDITVEKEAAAEIHQLNRELEERVSERTLELEEANKELESFTYSVAHDLRGPLRHIVGFSRILIEEFNSSLNPEGRRYLKRIEDGTIKMGQLVDELLNLARISRQEMTHKNVCLNSVLKEAIESWNRRLKDESWSGKSKTCQQSVEIQSYSSRFFRI
jgi:PAS domain S-box-containing protein